MNECELMLAVCGAALCENVEGSFLCLCASDLEEYDAQEGRCRPRGAGGEPCAPPSRCTPRCLAYTVLPLLQLLREISAMWAGEHLRAGVWSAEG